jgi:cytochrome P450
LWYISSPRRRFDHFQFWILLTCHQTRLAVRTFVVNRSKNLFVNPDEFVPERWLSDGGCPKEYSGDTLTASKPFSTGFHGCLGRPLAWLQMRLVMVKLLLEFDFSVDDEDKVSFDDWPVMMLIQKLPVRLRIKNKTTVN